MAKRKCPNCGVTLAPKDSPRTCSRCAALAQRSTQSPTEGSSAAVLLGSSVAELMLYIGEACDGWVRIVPHVTGDYSFKYKFTHGPHKGTYTFYVLKEYMPLHTGFSGILENIRRVNRGKLKPTPDIYRD